MKIKKIPIIPITIDNWNATKVIVTPQGWTKKHLTEKYAKFSSEEHTEITIWKVKGNTPKPFLIEILKPNPFATEDDEYDVDEVFSFSTMKEALDYALKFMRKNL